MKITASRKDEILKRKADYERRKAEYDEVANKRKTEFREKEQNVYRPIVEDLESNLSKYSELEFDIDATRGDFFGSSKGIEIKIRCNNNRLHDKDSALSWSYGVVLDKEGNPVKESSSWSGLNACTEKQLKSLRQTVEALEWLNSLDWATLLDKTLPSYDELVDSLPERPEVEDFSSELREAELEELIGKNSIIHVKGWESCPYRGDPWVKLIGETASQYKVILIPNFTVQNRDVESIKQFIKTHDYPNRVKKSTLKPVSYNEGFEIIDLD